jgi:hypothetical protein
MQNIFTEKKKEKRKTHTKDQEKEQQRKQRGSFVFSFLSVFSLASNNNVHGAIKNTRVSCM